MANSVGVPRSIDIATQRSADRELSLEWRSARWRVVVPAGLAAVSLLFSQLSMPEWLYQVIGAPGGTFAVYLSRFSALLTVVVAWRTAQARALLGFEQVLVGGAVVWLVGSVLLSWAAEVVVRLFG
jgi:hypothetical protein